MDDRKEFLLKMYDQMFNDIDRHHKIVWQVIGLLIGSFAFLALAEKGFIPIDIAVSVVILISYWVIAHVYDSNYWYNRNLVIIANIERQFLQCTDLKEIQYYFGKHRAKNALQTSLKIQLILSWGIIAIFLLYHIFTRLITDFRWCKENIQDNCIILIPYMVLIVCYFFPVRWIKSKREKNYLEFINNSPGIKVDTSGINYGGGHPPFK